MKRIVYTAARCAQRGMSLIEVLVAVAIGMIGILIMTQAYLASDEFNRATLGAGGAQTNGNVALFTVERDIRMGGYGINHAAALGCGNINYYIDDDYSGTLGGPLPNITLAPVVITPGVGLVPDQITVMYAMGEVRSVPAKISENMPSSSAELKVDGVETFSDNDLILLVNQAPPITCTLQQVTNVQIPAQKLQHNPGGSAPYNPAGGGLFTPYVKDDLIFNLGNPIVRIYSINTTDAKLRVVEFPFSNPAAGAGAGNVTLDLVDGMVDLRAQYGKDTDNDGDVDVYDNVAPATAAEWQQVLAVRLGVVARIGNYEKPTGANCDATTALPTWRASTADVPAGSGSTANPFAWTDFTDLTNQARCYRYRVFETTVPIRNMIWRFV